MWIDSVHTGIIFTCKLKQICTAKYHVHTWHLASYRVATCELLIMYYITYVHICAALLIEMDLHLFVVFRLLDGNSTFKKEAYGPEEAEGTKYPRSYA